VNPKSFTLSAGETRQLTVSYAPADSTYSWTQFDLINDQCNESYYASGVYQTRFKPRTPTLQLVQPNGGEVFLAGSDTSITWTGISPADTVQLEYSTDAGVTWSIAANKTTGGKYPWHVPRTPSNTCLVRVNQLFATNDSILTFSGHWNTVEHVSWSPDGSKLAASSDDGYTMVWDLTSGKMLYSFPNSIYWYSASPLAWSPDGSELTTAGADLWNINTGTLIKSISSGGQCVSWSPNGNMIVVGGVIINIAPDTVFKNLAVPSGGVNGVGWSPDGNKIVTANSDKTSTIWDATSGKSLNILKGHIGTVYSVSWSPDSKKIATGSADKTIKIWNASTGMLIRTINAHANYVQCVAWSPDGSKLASASNDGSAKIWDTSGVLINIPTNSSWVRSVSWNPDGSRIATAGDNNTAKIWEADPVMQSDISDSLFSIVMPMFQSLDVDMGKVLVGGFKDSVVRTFIHNAGTYTFRVDSISVIGADASQFTIVSGIPPFTVTAGSLYPIEFLFTPLSPGAKLAQINIFTRSDTLFQTIRGIGVSPQISVVDNLIDFGLVEVGSQKDSIRVVTIANTGTSPVTITQIEQGGPNIKDFSMLSGGPAFTMLPGDTARLDLRYWAAEVGRTNGQLLFDYDGIGSPARVILFGTGIQSRSQLASISALPFGILTCAASIDTSFTISNKGDIPLKIDSLRFVGQNPSDFTILTPLDGVTLPADTFTIVRIRFTPSALGFRSTQLLILSNAVPDSIFLIQVSGIKNSAVIEADTTMDLGVLCPDEMKDTLIPIRNTGNIPIGIRWKSSGSIDANDSTTIGVYNPALAKIQ
jgi:WD40 repeat protein